MVGAGVGTLTLIDHDTVDVSNLHRQWFFKESQLGESKAQSLTKHLTELNSEVNVNAVIARLAPDNVIELVADHDLIIDAADNFPTTYLLDTVCTERLTPLLTASVNQVYGYVGLLCGKDGPSLRAVFPRIPTQQTSCDVVGVIGPAVATVAGLQAQIALEALTGAQDRVGKMHYLDLRDFTLRSIDCRQAKAPTNPEIGFITCGQLQDDDWVVDVRETTEIRETPQPFAVQQCLPLSEFDANRISDTDRRVVLACRSGQRALIAAQVVLDNGIIGASVLIPGNDS